MRIVAAAAATHFCKLRGLVCRSGSTYLIVHPSGTPPRTRTHATNKQTKIGKTFGIRISNLKKEGFHRIISGWDFFLFLPFVRSATIGGFTEQ